MNKVVISFLVLLCAALHPLSASAIEIKIAEAVKLEFRSQTGLPIVDRSQHSECDHYKLTASEMSASATYADQQGWAVLNELSIGAFSFVAISPSMEPGLSGWCWIELGEVAVFESNKLIGTIHDPSQTQAKLGHIERIGEAQFRILNTENIPISDVQVRSDQVMITAPSYYISHCDGRVKTPNIYSETMPAARDEVLKLGWDPVVAEYEDRELFGDELYFYTSGVRELVSCSGTGAGFCAFQYKSRESGAMLDLITVGENYSVHRLIVEC